VKLSKLHKRRLYSIALILSLIVLAIGLVLFALRQNISLFYTPVDLEEFHDYGKLIRVGGMVEMGSVKHTKGLIVNFNITDYKKTLAVSYSGILPDLFREGQGVVVQGTLNRHHKFIARSVLAKHDENYMPYELKQALKEQKNL
jgi:cytochrome c-type biogenesis protein CcmE